MPNKTIASFLEKQKNVWLHKNIKPKTSDKKKESLKQQANELFTKAILKTTIQDIANNKKIDKYGFKNIDRLNFASHIPKFSNPSIKLDGFVFNAKKHTDGFLRTGNVDNVTLDIFSNSGAADHTKKLIYVYEFLTFYMNDKQIILEHLQQNTIKAKNLFAEFNIKNEKFNTIKAQLLLMVNKTEPTETNGAIKQVYFPVNDSYHLLSILYPSPIMNELRNRINNMKFSDKVKQAKEDKKKNIFNEHKISDIYNLTKIGFGGANKQNVSILNNKSGGNFYLLHSVPPTLGYRKIQPPKVNFFTSCLYVKSFDDDFKKLRKLFSDKDTMHIKSARSYYIKHIIFQILETVWSVRNIDANWSDSDTYKRLKEYQKIWLDKAYKDKRNEIDFDLIKQDLLKWLIKAYNKNIDKNTTKLNDNHKPYIAKIIDELQEILV
jgi:CRISPR-associated protein Csy1